ncbi:MAG: chromosome segregation protein SMC [Methylophilaceae bacterium]
MRLTHLKLAGFKSFVDPTTLHIHGQRVGVVGPNGCGKSNVMESVRWVLGESSAKEMRADGMDAVIFNGSGNRKPISRASVELVFDNCLAGAAGEWSQYAEISVKRVIERDKGSTYYINNTVVRRRDVADLFLGTGLGGRAYAIIGQNTINRIVEAKPEELRVFLEEAAGISKYKERRKETELRLRDTRENLTRVEDILRELDMLISRLQSQAVVAEQYYRLQTALNMAKAQVWLLKKRSASTRWEKARRNVEVLVNELEAQIASLRTNEAALETARQQNYTATEAVNVTQTRYYEINAEVSNLENQVKNTADAKERLQQQLQQLKVQLDKNTHQNTLLEGNVTTANAELATVNKDFMQVESAIQTAKQALPALSQQFKTAAAALSSHLTVLMSAEQKLRIEQTNAGHLARTQREANEHLQCLQQNLSHILVTPDQDIAEKQTQLKAIEVQAQQLEKLTLADAQQERSLMLEVNTQREKFTNEQRKLNLLEAEMSSMVKIQQSMKSGNNETALNLWLKSAGLDNQTRLWQLVTIKKGWETALEAVLGSKLNAVTSADLSIAQTRPPSALTIALTSTSPNCHIMKHQKTTLLDLIETKDANLQSVMMDWLTGAYLLEADEDAETARKALASGEYLVNQQGDIYSVHSITYFSAQSLLYGVLERQSQLIMLEQQLPDASELVTKTQAQLILAEQNLQNLRAEQQAKSLQLKTVTQQQHQLNLALQQIQQAQQNALQRQKSIQNDCATVESKLLTLNTEIEEKQLQMSEISSSVAQMHQDKKILSAEKQKTESVLHNANTQLQNMERTFQECHFNLKLKNNSINELNIKINNLLEEKASLKLRHEEAVTLLAATKMEALNENLVLALNCKQTCEAVLAKARNALSECEQMLLQHERARMQTEQLLHPLRDKLEASRLSEQEARINFEQCKTALNAFNMSENELNLQLGLLENDGENTLKVLDVEKKLNQLNLEIEALGAVNLAAIQELETEQIRKTYLNSQCKDLLDATDTLESAIRKIDVETRGRLQSTFDEANRHFAELFATLFGGGLARLELLGEEILDAGMLVFAQPPGKKNNTIHMLSGGEKALTALALVFALFRLNPAPFCLMDEVDAPLDDSNTERFCAMVKKMSEKTQFLYVSHNKITMEMAQQLIGVTMQESGVSRIVDVDMEAAVKMTEVAVV